MVKLTKRALDAVRYEGDGNSRHVLWDSEINGFGCRIYPTGRKSFVLSYRAKNRKRMMTIGSYGALTLEQARKRARAELAKVETGEADPLEVRQQAAKGETVADLCTAYMERHGSAKKSARDIDRFKEAKRDRWITPQELPHLAQAINQEANQSARFGLWLYLLTGARKSELLQARWSDIDRDRAELRIADTKVGRTHYIPLSAAALVLLDQMPRTPGNPYILPGRAPSNTTNKPKAPSHLVNITKPWNRVKTAAILARWREIPEAAALIDRLAAERAGAKSKHTAKDYRPAPALAEIRQAAAAEGIELPRAVDDVRLHDLRRTVGSRLAQAGNSLHLIGRVLNHSNASTTQIYARFGEDSVRAALEQHGARIIGAAGLASSADVSELHPTRKTA